MFQIVVFLHLTLLKLCEEFDLPQDLANDSLEYATTAASFSPHQFDL